MYAVCKQQFFKTTQKETQVDRFTGRAVTIELWRADFSEHEETLVRDMAHAKEIYGGYPVLSKCGKA